MNGKKNRLAIIRYSRSPTEEKTVDLVDSQYTGGGGGVVTLLGKDSSVG